MESNSNTFHPGSRGHPIFLNQPPHTVFNKHFDDPNDALYLRLHEIHPACLKEEDLQHNKGFQIAIVSDPRTQQSVARSVCNYAQKRLPRIFRSDLKSCLTRAQHVVCLRVLLGWQEQREVSEPDFLLWASVKHKRLKEYKLMQQFVLDWAQLNRETMYSQSLKFVQIYQQWYMRRAQSIIDKELDSAYNTYVGIPKVRSAKTNLDLKPNLSQVELLSRRGYLILLGEGEKIDCIPMHFRLERFADTYNQTLPQLEGILDNDIRKHMGDSGGANRFFIPLDSILFLLTAGDYVDLPLEMFLDIQSGCEDELKSIIFQKPLPARNCGWHTHNAVAEQAFAAYLTGYKHKKWLRVDNKEVTIENAENMDINGVPKGGIPFKPLEFADYLKNYAAIPKPKQNEKFHFNQALLKWRLQDPETLADLELLTAFQIPMALDETASKCLASHSIKIEYKPEFGCEIMTKYELIKSWLQIHLMSSIGAADHGICLRLAVNNFETQLEERLTLPSIEHQLLELYHIDMPALVANLANWLQMLLKMPVGKYLLRHSIKYKDQFLLCSPAKETTQNTISLRSLLEIVPSDWTFMLQKDVLPISEGLCSIVHRAHNILPCTFLPPFNENVDKKKLSKPPKATPFVNDRELLLKRISDEKANKEKVRKTLHKRKRNRKKRLQRTRKKSEAANTLEEGAQLQRDIEEAKMLFGF